MLLIFQEDHANAQTECDEARSHHAHYENKKKEQEKKINNINKLIDKLQAEIKVKTLYHMKKDLNNDIMPICLKRKVHNA